MNRWSLGIVAVVSLIGGTMDVAQAQVFYGYDAPAIFGEPVYSSSTYVPGVIYQSPVLVPARPVVTAAYVSPYAYSAPVVVPQPITQMAYSTTVTVPVRTIIAEPVVVRPNLVRETTRVSPHNYTQTVRVYGPTDGPRYSRVHVHSGLFGTTVRQRVR